MCGIAGICNFTENMVNNKLHYANLVSKMGKPLVQRGPDDFNLSVGEHFAFVHTRLAVVDIAGGIQPMTRSKDGFDVTIVYNGELYNTKELRTELEELGYSFTTHSDTEVLLNCYLAYGTDCPKHLNGIFAFAVYDEFLHRVFLCRDRFGIKPLFYVNLSGQYLFSSEIKGLLAHPDCAAKLDTYGLCEIFGLGPARSPGNGIFQNIHELMPGYAAIIDYSGMTSFCYWELTAKEHTDTYEQTVEKTRFLLLDSIKRQLASDVPLCTLLSGGIDSSLVSAVASQELKKQGKTLSTYSFDYIDNDKFFTASGFQPTEDKPFVTLMTNAILSNHTYLECDNQNLFSCLFDAMLAKDLPGMADIDSSLLYFAGKIKEKHTVCLSGECADEIFGGYPWFRDEKAFKDKVFPWSKDLSVRTSVINPALLSRLPLEEYVRSRYERTIAQVPRLDGENETEARRREISYLNIRWFMSTLLDRKDRMTMASGLEVRVPFADHRLVEYIYNVPWEFKYHNHTVKGLLRDAAKGLLPAEVLWRKKSPYPKTYHPNYEKLLKQQLFKILNSSSSALQPLINKDAVLRLMEQSSDYGKPWFGQLMATPQLFAYLIQIETWLTHYNIDLSDAIS